MAEIEREFSKKYFRRPVSMVHFSLDVTRRIQGKRQVEIELRISEEIVEIFLIFSSENRIFRFIS